MNFSKAPEHQIHWGMIDSKCETAMINWVKSVIDMVVSSEATSNDSESDFIIEKIDD